MVNRGCMKNYLIILFMACGFTTLLPMHEQKRLNKALFDAIEAGDKAVVKDLINSGVNQNAQVDDKNALMQAIKHDQYDIIKILIGYEADPNRLAPNGMTSLTFAAFTEKPEAALLLQQLGGGDPLKKDTFDKNMNDYLQEKRLKQAREKFEKEVTELQEEFTPLELENENDDDDNEEWILLDREQ